MIDTILISLVVVAAIYLTVSDYYARRKSESDITFLKTRAATLSRNHENLRITVSDINEIIKDDRFILNERIQKVSDQLQVTNELAVSNEQRITANDNAEKIIKNTSDAISRYYKDHGLNDPFEVYKDRGSIAADLDKATMETQIVEAGERG